MTSSPHRKAGPIQGLILLSCITLAVMGALVIVPIVPQMMVVFKDMPNAPYWVSMIITIPSLCVAFLSPLAGWLGDRFGRRRLLIPAMGLYSLCGIMPYFLNDFKLIFLSRIGVGIMEAIAMTLSTTMIGDLFSGQTRDRWLAGQTAVASISAVIFLFIGGHAGRESWHTPFLVYLFPLLLMFLLILFTWEPAAAAHAEDKHAEDRHVEDRAAGSDAPPAPVQRAAFPWLFMAAVCAVTLFATLLFYTIQIEFSTALAQIGITDPGQIGNLTAIASLAVPLGTVCFWVLSRRLKVSQLLFIEFLGFGLAYVAMHRFQSDFRAVVAFAALSQIAAGMTLPTLLTWASSRLHYRIRGLGTGLWQAVMQSGQFVCGLVFTYISVTLNAGVMSTFQIFGVAALAAALLCLLTVFLNRTRTSSDPVPVPRA